MRRASIRVSASCNASRLARLLALAAVPLLVACSTPRPVPSEELMRTEAAADAEETREILRGAVERMLTRVMQEAVEDGRGSIDILAMSGGADYGAFGAGVLVGWGQVEDPDLRRPQFDAVTGVSTGALLAPFAFLGTDEDCLTIESLYREPLPDWIVTRGLVPIMPWNVSLATIPGLERAIDEIVDLPFVQRLAAQARAGRVLAVSATDLDLGRQKTWDLSVEAEVAAAEGTARPIQQRLLASAAVPVMFPPVMIDDHLYVDGGVTSNVLLRLVPKDPSGFVQRWLREHPGRPWPRMRYWVILNNFERHQPKIVQPRWTNVLTPSLEVVIRSATLAELRWLAAEADYCNAVFGTGIEMRVISIPDEWKPPVEGAFKKETMNSLADLGRELGRDPAAWRLWTAPLDGSLDGGTRPSVQ